MKTVVWLKKDLRIRDHAPLAEASKGECVVLYIYEPEIIKSAEFDPAHLQFLNDCLHDLAEQLHRCGGKLITRAGEAVQVLQSLRSQFDYRSIFAHEETGNGISYARDRRVRQWAGENNIAFHEYPQTGVVRRLESRDGWSKTWDKRMKQPIVPPPRQLRCPELESKGILDESAFALPLNNKTIPKGGECAGHAVLQDFLAGRGKAYSGGISSPLTAEDACSRISPYLAFGALSMKQIKQATEKKRTEERNDASSPDRSQWLRSLKSFDGRLHWHCHFMQKLEDEPRLEFENLHRGCDGLRENDFNEENFQRWCEGQTGYPLVDACMRQVLQNGWTNFRMRAMLVSFASYNLWLHWQKPAQHLAKHFLDFEPGIHFSQFQMQSGTTGMNTLRMYNPIKQAKDHDEEGTFVRRWIPELRHVSDQFIFEPWTMPGFAEINYPSPVVDYKESIAHARDCFRNLRRSPEYQKGKEQIVQKHGSRRRTGTRPRKKKAAPEGNDLFSQDQSP